MVHLDVVLPNSGSAKDVLIFRNNGNGTNFSLVNRFGDTISSPGVASKDLDHDGNADVVVMTFGGAAAFLGNGDFTFNGPFASGQFISSFELGEFDGDGEFDLVGFVPGSFNFTGEFGVMKGYGDGTFNFVTRYPAATDFEFFMDEVMPFDLNDDGFDDVVTSNGPSSDVSIFFNNGDGTLRHHDGHRYGVGYQASDAVIADFNGDGIRDIACSVNYGDATVIFGTASGGPAVVVDFNIVTGTIIDGDLSNLETSDDTYLHTNSGFGRTLIDLHHMELSVAAVTTVPSPTTLDLAIESRIDQPAGTMQVRLRNWNTGQLDLVGSTAIGNTEDVDEFLGIDATNYVNAQGEIEASIKHLVFVPFLAFQFESFIDQVAINVR